MTPTSQTLVNEIKHIYQQLAKASPSLQPSEHINALFTKLVQICIRPVDQVALQQVLNHPTIRQLEPHLRQLCSHGEYLMELACQQLAKFTYYNNYVDLTRLECHALLGLNAQLKRIVWIGSGPLPLSSMEMMIQHHDTIQHIDNIDLDPEAIQVSRQLGNRLPWPSSVRSRFHYHAMNALEYPDYRLANVICLGALVGCTDKEKQQVIIHVANNMRPGACLLIRSAHGLRQLLYPALIPSVHLHPCPQLLGLLELLLELHPHNDVVNSVLIARRIG
ncbi:Nicotianamine synthase [Chlamydoabsidia padenii]|nr:Nicotianamine synthase [Chlamydoabsidia padenii]